MNESARDTLLRWRLEYLCDYLTSARWAEHHGLTDEEALELLRLARKVAEHPHPDA